MFLISVLDGSSKVLSWVGSTISFAIPFSKHNFFRTDNQKAVLLTVFSLFEQFFSCGGCGDSIRSKITTAVAKENLLKTPAIVSLTNFQIFKFCCDIQGSRLIGYLWVSLIIYIYIYYTKSDNFFRAIWNK